MGREVILKAILDSVYPHDLVPCMYRVDGISAYFFARNCFPAIEKLCHQYLTIVNAAELKIPVRFRNFNEKYIKEMHFCSWSLLLQ